MLLELLVTLLLLFGIVLVLTLMFAAAVGVYLIGQDIGFWK